jgi:hypothetical protein
MPGSIFINYRRGDDPGNAGRLFDSLSKAFDAGQLFMDVENIRPGTDFVALLDQQVSDCDVMLSVIGKDWLNARGEDGKRRLDNPNDFVRIEIEAALRIGKRIIPVLVHNAQMPSEAELPPTLKPLARLQAVRLTHERFHADVQGLIEGIAADLKTHPALRDNSFPKADALRAPAFYFARGQTLATFGYPGEQEYTFESERAAFIRLFPSQYHPPIGLAKMTELFQKRIVQPMSPTIGGLAARNTFGPIIIDPESNTTIGGLTQGFSTGELWGISRKIFVPRMLDDWFTPTERQIQVQVIPTITFEKLFAKVLTEYVSAAAAHLHLQLPYTIKLGISGLNGVYLGCPGGETGNGSIEGPIMQDSLQKDYGLLTNSEASIVNILRSFFTEVYDSAACERAKIITEQLALNYGLPSPRAR